MLSKYLKSEKGNVTVEFVIWAPFYVAAIAMTTNVAMTLATMTAMVDVSRDTARRVSVGDLSAEQAVVYAEGRLSPSYKPHIEVNVIDNRDVKVEITAAPGYILVPAMKLFIPGGLSVNYVMRKEGTTHVGV
ncbi:hypothetical protein ATO6_14165 [Oceanicola sp. 22II-s10i]|uniref:TadE/TadG family type IV pilus assembly protein n=1 Tax=Oceanicola sp. 22II-s10i TaxID=1317116 RepID=UPI000B524C64|nr:hypothetical protein [Oceanicola sp. 22II-s10i]OWU84192.1 hypothetical protein ATO6_14165 [Oceanicola sp. 22II-s10i]